MSSTDPARPLRRPLPEASLDLLNLSARGLAAATVATSAAERYAEAHLSALRAAAAVLAARARPGRRGPCSVWILLPEVAPEMGEWAAFFAAGSGKRAAAAAGLPVAGTREADDLLRDAALFLALVETTLGLAHQGGLPLTG